MFYSLYIYNLDILWS